MHKSLTRKSLTTVVVAGVVAASTLLVAGPASAAPGDAEALGAAASFDFTLGLIDVDIDGEAGRVSVTGAGEDSASIAGATLIDVLDLDANTGAVETVATSDAVGSAAAASVLDTDVDFLGLDLLTADEATAAAVCVVGEPPTAEAALTGLTLLGQTATVNADTPSAEAFADLDGELEGVRLTVQVRRVVTTGPTSAAAIALQADVLLTGTLAGAALPDQIAGSFTLASASCETPTVVPVTATGITPGTGPTTGGQTVTITGSGFVPGVTTVTFGATPATGVTVLNPTTITAVTPVGAAGPTTVTVANPSSSAALPYVYVAPAVVDFTPGQGPEAGGTNVTFTGQGLGTVVSATFGGTTVPVTSVDPSGTAVVVETPPGSGVVDVSLTLAGGTVLVAEDRFLYVGADDPTVDGLSPSSGPTAGGTTVTITGDNLADVTEVSFGGNPGTIVGTPTDTEIVVVTPPGVAGPVDVLITSPDGSALVEDGFVYVAPPVLGQVTPDSGSVAGGTPVTVDGSGFIAGATTVTICGVTIPASAVTVNADGTQLGFTSPPCAAGVQGVTVATVGGVSDAGSFRYLPSGTAGTGNAGSGALAATGAASPIAPLVGGGILLLLGGLVLMVARQRRLGSLR